MEATTPSCVAQRTVKVAANDLIARDTCRLQLEDPEMAACIRPGQFLMVRPSTGSDPMLGRPFALYEVGRDAAGVPATVDVVYLVVGRGTTALSSLRPGDRATIWGPLGNGFGPAPDGPVVFVAGGIGQTPFLTLGRWWTGRVCYGIDRLEPPFSHSATMLYGVRTADLFAGLNDFREAGIALELATDDGSMGHRGYATDLLVARLERGERPAKVIGCGPAPMLATLSRILEKYKVDGDLSLENHMACGFGACFSCVAPIRQEDGSEDLKRVCVEGPIFPARSVIFAS